MVVNPEYQKPQPPKIKFRGVDCPLKSPKDICSNHYDSGFPLNDKMRRAIQISGTRYGKTEAGMYEMLALCFVPKPEPLLTRIIKWYPRKIKQILRLLEKPLMIMRNKL